MKHIYNKAIKGYVQIDKCSLGDLAELARVSADYIRVLFCIYRHADAENTLICDMSTIAKILDIDISKVTEAVRYLADNAYIEVDCVRLSKHTRIYHYLNSQDYYRQDKDFCWITVGTDELIETFSDNWLYNRIIVNAGITKCSDNRIPNIIVKHEGNEMFAEGINK